jgi:hypothetical protein
MSKLVLIASLMAALASPALAANARHPYQNCDRRVDNCGPTGDQMTDQLNAQQLNQTGAGTQGLGSPGPSAQGGYYGAPGRPMAPQ